MLLNAKRLIAAAALSVSAGGIGFIAQWEGVSYEPYLDVANVPTVCHGHTSNVEDRMYTEGECLILLEGDASTAENAVRKYVRVPISQLQYDALVSFTFNVGAGAFSRSTLLRKLNAGDYEGAADEFLRWTYAGGKHYDGLLNRRMDERGLFLRGTYQGDHHVGST